MTAIFTEHKDSATLIVALLAMVLSVLFGYFNDWRHKINFEYDSKRGAAITALKDEFEEEAQRHYKSIRAEIRETGAAVQVVYQTLGQRQYIRSLALKLEKRNKIIRLHSRLVRISNAVQVGLWLESIFLMLCLGLSGGIDCTAP